MTATIRQLIASVANTIDECPGEATERVVVRRRVPGRRRLQ